MAEFTGCLSTAKSPEAVFDYLVDFTNVTEWDPGTRQAQRTQEGEFVLTAGFFGSTIDLTYSIVEQERPTRLVLDVAGDGIEGCDTITIAASSPDGDTRVTYAAEIVTTGLKKLLAPAVTLGFSSVARKALDGLATALDGHIVDC